MRVAGGRLSYDQVQTNSQNKFSSGTIETVKRIILWGVFFSSWVWHVFFLVDKKRIIG